MEERIHPPGTWLGGYEIISHRATGSETALYVARNLSPTAEHRGPVALKVCRFDPRTLSRDEVSRFNDRHAREYTLLSHLWNRNIVHVFEQRVHEGLAFFALELLEGPTLGTWWAAERRTFLEVMRVYRQLAGAVAYAHGRGIVHRDLKPSNVRIEGPRETPWDVVEWESPGGSEALEAERFLSHARAQPVLLDFSVAQSLFVAPVTLPGSLVGTAEYLSPEYARHALSREDTPYRATPSEDVYQLGVMLYLLLTGRHPVRTPAGQLWDLLEEIRDVTPPSPRGVNPQAPSALSALCEACLSKHPNQRPADGAELQARLARAMQEDAAALNAPAPMPGELGETTFEPRKGNARRRSEEQLRGARKLIRWRLGAIAMVLLSVGLGAMTRWLKFAPEPSSPTVTREQTRGPELTNAPQTPASTSTVLTGRPMPPSPEPSWMKCPKDCGFGSLKPCVLKGHPQFGLVGYRGTCWRKGENRLWSPDPAQRKKCPSSFDYDPPPDAPEALQKLCFDPMQQDSGEPNAVEP